MKQLPRASFTSPLTLAAVGCGARSQTYCGLAAAHPERYRVVAGADPRSTRVEKLREISGNPHFRGFESDEEFFAQPKMADVCIIGTQDAYHLTPASRALDLGYDILLEKPVSTDLPGIRALLEKSERLGRKILVCHVLRYSPFFVEVKKIVASGQLGEIMTIDAREGVEPWHQAHSYVRGSWAKTAEATPMLIAKCCHDTDILSWLADRPCERVSSFGRLTHFTKASAPVGAPEYCLEGCPVEETCAYNARHYMDRHRSWLFVKDGGAESPDHEVKQWLNETNYGRCVYRCENDAVDHQVIALEFDGGLTATFTMTAFDTGRNIVINGTKGVLRGGEATKEQSGSDMVVTMHHTGERFAHQITYQAGGYDSHMGADTGLVEAMDQEFRKPAREMRSGIHSSIEAHTIGFAAEKSRLSGEVIRLNSLQGYLNTLR